MGEYSGREPCPYRIIDDVGGAFAMGAVGGSIWHSIKGFRNSPVRARARGRGARSRAPSDPVMYPAPVQRGDQFRGAIDLCKARAPVVGGNFAVWGGLFACFDCTLTAVRHKEDPWNSILAGAATGGTLAIRGAWILARPCARLSRGLSSNGAAARGAAFFAVARRAAGPKAVAKNAAIGGFLLMLIEGLTVAITKARSTSVPRESLPTRARVRARARGNALGLTRSRARSHAPPSPSPRLRAAQWSAPTPLKKEDFEHDPTEPPLQPGLLPPMTMPTVEGVQDFFTSSDSQTDSDNLSIAPMSAFDLSGNTPEEAPKPRRGGLMGRLLGLGGK